jgi:hypothetical protein
MPEQKQREIPDIFSLLNLPSCLRVAGSFLKLVYQHGHIKRKEIIDYCLSSLTQLTRGIWMSFFDTEAAHAVMLAYAANGGGRAALKVTPTSLNL